MRLAETIKGNVVIKTQMPVDEAKKQLADLQKSLDKLKIPDKLKDSFTGTFDGLNKELDKLQKRLNTGLNTKTDLTGFEKTSRNVEVLYTELDKLMAKVRDLGDTPFAGQTTQEIERMKKEVEALQQSLGSIGKNNSQLAELKANFGEASNATEALKKRVKEFTATLEIGDTSGMEKALNSIEVYAKRYESLDKKSDNQSKWVDAYQKAAAAAAEYSKAIQTTESRINSLSGQVLTKQNDLLEKNKQSFAAARVEAKSYGDSVATTAEEISSSTSSILNLNSQVDSLVGRISNIVSIAGAFTMLRRAIRSAYDDVKELDAAMNSIAIVTDFTTQELWGQVDAYSELAQEMGVSLVGVYDVQKLYYQQGRDAADVASLTTDTLRFARIAEMDYADATDAMTVAINAFKLEASDATRIIDVYSQLAARAAVDQNELATAMSKVASMASSVGMSLESTSAFLTQIIETTRESPETAGTALKTIDIKVA